MLTMSDEDARPGDLGFTFRRRNRDEVQILHRGRVATTLRHEAAADFLGEMARMNHDEAQQRMARATGNFKRGNERLAATHPRNRKG